MKYIGAHRGGSHEEVENILGNICLSYFIDNFKKGRDTDATIQEMDVCINKDKQVVVIHDP